MPRKGLPLKWDQVGLPVPQWISLNYSWICYRLGFPFASLHILPGVLTSPRSQIRINLSNRGMQTYFGHLQFTHLHTAGFERCMYIILVFFFFVFCSLRDLRTIIKAFRGTTPIIHMMSTGKCLQHQKYDCHRLRGRRYPWYPAILLPSA